MMSSASSNPPLLSHVRTVAALRKVTDSVKRELDVHPTLPNTLVFSDGRPYAFDLVLPDFDPQVENEAGQLQGQQLMERVFHGLNVGLLHVSIGYAHDTVLSYGRSVMHAWEIGSPNCRSPSSSSRSCENF
jgi:hypothetical protein